MSGPASKNVLASAPDRDALIDVAHRIYLSGYMTGIASTLLDRGTHPVIAEQNARQAVTQLAGDPAFRASIEAGLITLMSGFEAPTELLKRRPRA